MAAWTIRPIRLRDEHLPHGLDSGKPACRPCGTAWPCEHGQEYLTESRCTCGQPVWREHGPRNWHVGPLCYTPADVTRWQAAELKAAKRWWRPWTRRRGAGDAGPLVPVGWWPVRRACR
jgi:hypothetical protein